MKYRIETDEGEKIFLYEDIFIGNLYVTKTKFQVEKNMKIFGIITDFTKPVRMAMIRDLKKNENIVIVTVNLDENNRMQFLIDNESILNECPDELKQLFEQAFQMRDMSSPEDLFNIINSQK